MILNTTVSGNTATFSGGGIENAFGEMTLQTSTVSGNTAGSSGGGIVHRGALVIANSTVSGNQADEQGGGINSGGNGTVLTIKSGTVSANSAPEGANLRESILNPSATIQSTILSSPQGGGANCFVGAPPATLTSNGYNLASDASCNLTAPTDQASTDPGLGPLQANGGPTETMALLPSSPAIEKGIAAGLTTDQRGFNRPVVFPWIPNAAGGDGSDIGAFEVQALAPPPTPATPTPAPFSASDNRFGFGKVQKNRKKGTAKLTVIVPGPGELRLAGRKVKVDSKRVEPAAATSPGQIEAVLTVRAKGKAKKKLGRIGKARVKVNVTYTPTAGTPNTKGRKLTLNRRAAAAP